MGLLPMEPALRHGLQRLHSLDLSCAVESLLMMESAQRKGERL